MIQYCTEIRTDDGVLWSGDTISAINKDHAFHILNTTGRGYMKLNGYILIDTIPFLDIKADYIEELSKNTDPGLN